MGRQLPLTPRFGVSANEAATGIIGALRAIIKPTQLGAEQLAKYGRTVEDVAEQVGREGLVKTLNDLRSVMTDTEFSRYLGRIRGIRFALAVTGEQFDAFSGVLGKVQRSAGRTDEAFEAVNETASFAFTKMTSALNAALIELGNKFLPTVVSVADAITGMVTDDDVQRSERMTLALSKFHRAFGGADQDNTKIMALRSAIQEIGEEESSIVKIVDALMNLNDLDTGALRDVSGNISDLGSSIIDIGTNEAARSNQAIWAARESQKYFRWGGASAGGIGGAALGAMTAGRSRIRNNCYFKTSRT